MTDIIRNPAIWAALAAILAALGVELPEHAGETILEWLSVVAGIIAIVFGVAQGRGAKG